MHRDLNAQTNKSLSAA